MKESGLNYFYGALDLYTGAFATLYTFENNAGSTVSSISGGQSGYSGTLSSVGTFWASPGSGNFAGQTLRINNASGLDSTSWTKIFSYEKVNVEPCVLFDSMSGSSGFRIGITKTNKPYFESYNQEPVIAASLNNYSSKNVISFTYLPNYLSIGLYNWNSKTVESEQFVYPFNIARSDDQKIGGPQFTGYMDYYIHLTQPMSAAVQSQWLSGLFAKPTGNGFVVSQLCVTGITGYQNVFVGTTGVTGYVLVPGGGVGQGYYTGAFPITHTQLALTGYLSSGLYASGLSGVSCTPVTGAATLLFDLNSGYAASFGMEKIQYFSFLNTGDTVKNAVSYTPWNNIYNITTIRQYSGYLYNPAFDTGILDLYLNGVALANDGWTLTGSYIIVTGAQAYDGLFYDVKSGNKRSFTITGAPTSVTMSYSGQELYLNGVNLVSGSDYFATSTTVSLTNLNSGVTGYLTEYPIVLISQTGRYTFWTGARFWRDTTNAYMNGVRQESRALYIEGSNIDKLSGNFFNTAICIPLYTDTDLYWE